MNMVPTNVKVELIKLVYELQEASVKFGAGWQGHGTAKKHEEKMAETKQRLHDMIERL
ncbi:hypothetical protein [Edwardsiella phage PEi26]|uniref:Uncharacterized protein n=1 Tax=Edwardsiella phage PEi26 TaxID=1608311 RepID=A0A0B6VTU7_9CAUD|nr:hypothetical protein [Edwardsiella phage PEi26]